MMAPYAHGTVKDGRVVLDEGAMLPEGERVVVRVIPAAPKEAAGDHNGSPGDGSPTLRDTLKEFIGCVDGPPDLAANHGYYAHRQPKQQS
jgi:hypothetical protein